MALLIKFLTVQKCEFNPYKKLYKSTILKQMARPQWVNDHLRRNKVGKITYFSNSAIFHVFSRKYIGPTVTVYVGKSSSESNCHIVTVGPRFWGTNVRFLVGRTVRPLWDSDLDQLSLGLNNSPIVTRTNRVGRIVTRTKHVWTKRQGTLF
jgi:hypothetical protein